MGLKHPFGGVGVDYDYGWPINNALNSDPYSMASYAPAFQPAFESSRY